MFITRTISGFILVVIVALAFYLGPLATNILMCFVSLVGVMELLRVYKLNKSKSSADTDRRYFEYEQVRG